MSDSHTKEEDKAWLSRPEAIAYTINHSVYCTLTDFINPVINAATDGYLRHLFPGCGHDHSHGEQCAHHPSPPANATRWEKVKWASKDAFSKERFLDYAKGEFIGDIGAVPVTIAVQRLAPDFLYGIEKAAEPMMHPIFRFGAQRDAKQWAKDNGLSDNDPETLRHQQELLNHEMKHFPLAVVWSGAALGLNTAYQMTVDKTPMPFANKLLLKSASVLSGIGVTAGVVVAARALAPSKMMALDRWTADTLIAPTSNAINAALGIPAQDTAAMQRSEHDVHGEHSWTQRINTTSNENSPSR